MKLYCHKRLQPAKRFAKGSFRTIRRGGNLIRIACPKGKWNSRTERCKVGTRAQAILKPKRGRACPAGYK